MRNEAWKIASKCVLKAGAARGSLHWFATQKMLERSARKPGADGSSCVQFFTRPRRPHDALCATQVEGARTTMNTPNTVNAMPINMPWVKVSPNIDHASSAVQGGTR
jgi:hypothetical protein